jgi:hypothetical protein
MSLRILNVSGDPEIASLRARVMTHAGFDVRNVPCPNTDIPPEPFEVMVVCYSVPNSEMERVTSEFRDRNPGACVVAVLRMPWDPNCDHADECVQALEGPAALIKAIKECTPKVKSAAV